MSDPVAGNHNDFHDIEVQFEVVTATLKQTDIPVEGSYRSLLYRFDTTIESWKGFNYLAFFIIALKKIKKKKVIKV